MAWLSLRCVGATSSGTPVPPGTAAAPTVATPPPTPAPTHLPSPTPAPFVNPYGTVDASTLERKMVFGYQGWFAAAGDGSRFGNEWHHWSTDPSRRPNAGNIHVDNWPDLSEFEADELFPTDLTYPDGRQVFVYSGYTEKTVLRHFRWMGEHGIDGVTVQRFLQTPWDPRAFDFRNRVLRLARQGAERYGRVFAVEMDLSSMKNDLGEHVKTDWMYIVDELRATESPRYLRHRGRPVLGVWGLGFNGNPLGADEARQLVDWLQRDAPERYRVTILGGVPWSWRTQSSEKSDPAWAAVYRRVDVISPWHVGAILPADKDVEEWRRRIVAPDLTEAKAAGRDYMPVVFPGFSWANLMRSRMTTPQKLNAYPRRGGAFWWKQVYEDLAAGSTMVKAAMFDELDEGTATYKLAPTAAQAPAQPGYVTLDADGISLPSDWYLRLGGAGTKMLRGEIPLTPTIPIKP